MMKKFIFLIFLFLTSTAHAQLTKSLSFEGIIGARLNLLLHENGFVWNDFLVTSPMLGVKVKHQQYPFTLSFLHDRNIFFKHYPRNKTHDISAVSAGNMLRVQYEAKKFRYGLGHYWLIREDWGNFHFLGPAIPIRYIAFMFALPFGRAEIEFQSLMRYTLFDIGDRYLQELNFKYHFGGQKKKEQVYATRFVRLNLLVGGRFFLPDQFYRPPERKNKIGTMASVGVEVLVEKYRTGVYWEKDWWIALNGGSSVRQIKGQITDHIFGLKYHHPLKNKQSLNIGIGYAWIMDFSTLDETRTKIKNGQESRKLANNNIRGVSLSPSFDVNEHFRVELRQIIATRGEKGLALERLSLGLFYKITP